MTASGTAGYGDELGRYVDLSTIGAVVVKSLSADPWAGNPPPRLHETPAGMLNAVGLQNEGVEHWLAHELPVLQRHRATVVASIWGTAVEDYVQAATLLAAAPETVVAIEVNVSCPNHHARDEMFAHSCEGTTEVIGAVRDVVGERPIWAKLSPNVTDLPSIAGAAHEAGADAVTLVTTVMGMISDVEARRPLLAGGKGGGLSGPAIHPVAVRAVYEVHAALPTLPIVGVGGVATGEHAVELLLAGASAVQVGTATFADPRAVRRVVVELEQWCRRHGVATVRELIGEAHG
ncbi:MAG: dihydroorotate dehydrogenase [Actinobacteria bacterium]|nr:dihydroorotate dehydrogenase [Actinomycetota bacterium]